MLPESSVNSELPELSYRSCELYSSGGTSCNAVVTAFGLLVHIWVRATLNQTTEMSEMSDDA